MKKSNSIRRMLSVFLTLIVCAGCCMPALAVEEPTVEASVIEEPRDMQETVLAQSSGFPDVPIDRIITPPIPAQWLIPVFIPALFLESLRELPILMFGWLEEKLSDAWYAIQDFFADIELFFYNLIYG